MTEDQFNTLQAQLNDITLMLKSQNRRIHDQQRELERINSQFFGPFYADLTTRMDDLEYVIREGQVIAGIHHDKIWAEIALMKSRMEVQNDRR